MTLYERIRQELWLRDKQGEGKSLILNDDSVWKVDAKDQFLTKRWLRGSTIVVEYSKQPGFSTAHKGKLRELTTLGMFAPLVRLLS